MTWRILAINPGSTSTKVGIYQDTEEISSETIAHRAEDLACYSTIQAQFAFRLDWIKQWLASHNIDLGGLNAVVARGGLLRPLVGGTYRINDRMLADLFAARYGQHASNLGAIMADSLAAEFSIPAFIVDPVVVDELEPVARVTGRPEAPKRSIFHALNQKAVAKRYALSINRKYEDLNLIVAHLGGGISVGCHKQGRVVEVNNALDGDGPFSPERAGTIQAGTFVGYILENKLDYRTVARMLAGQGGLVAYFGTQDAREIEKKIHKGDKDAEAVYNAMIYQIARYIAGAAVPVRGKVDAIILTGGMAYSDYIVRRIKEHVEFLAPVTVLPGENELQALVEGALRVMTGAEPVREY